MTETKIQSNLVFLQGRDGSCSVTNKPATSREYEGAAGQNKVSKG